MLSFLLACRPLEKIIAYVRRWGYDFLRLDSDLIGIGKLINWNYGYLSNH